MNIDLSHAGIQDICLYYIAHGLKFMASICIIIMLYLGQRTVIIASECSVLVQYHSDVY